MMAYTIPMSALVGLKFKGIFLYFTPFYVFFIIPVIEIFMTKFSLDKSNQTAETKNKAHWIFDLMLYLNLPLIFAIILLSLNIIQSGLKNYEFIGLVFSVGIVISSNGINVAHELCHRTNFIEKSIGKVMLIPSLYMHFYLEHNFGHHLNVATKQDPVTAKYNEPLYSFWISAIKGELIGAIKIQKQRLSVENRSFFSFYNDFLWYAVIQTTYLILIVNFFGFIALIFSILIALVSILLFESVNYIEHYGLLRKKTRSGRYERVQLKHSWNSNHSLGRIVLYELTRHSDHHKISSKKYQNLESYDEAPQLPYGYPTSILIALLPWVWFRLINPRIPKEMVEIYSKN